MSKEAIKTIKALSGAELRRVCLTVLDAAGLKSVEEVNISEHRFAREMQKVYQNPRLFIGLVARGVLILRSHDLVAARQDPTPFIEELSRGIEGLVGCEEYRQVAGYIIKDILCAT